MSFLGWVEGYLILIGWCKCYYPVTPQCMKLFCCVHLSLRSQCFSYLFCEILQPDQRHDRKGRCLSWTCNQSPLQDYRCEFCFWFLPCVLSTSLLLCHHIQKNCIFNYANYTFHGFTTDHHATGHWAVHEAGYCWQGAQCVQFSPGLFTGKEYYIVIFHFSKWLW